MEIWEHILFISIPIIFVVLVKFLRSVETDAEQNEYSRNEIQYSEPQKIENHYHTHDNRVVNIIVKDGTELKTVLSKKANQTKLLGD